MQVPNIDNYNRRIHELRQKLTRISNGLYYGDIFYSKVEEILYLLESIETDYRRDLSLLPAYNVSPKRIINQNSYINAKLTQEGYLLLESELPLFRRECKTDSLMQQRISHQLNLLQHSQNGYLPKFKPAAAVFYINNMLKDADNLAVAPVLDSLKGRVIIDDNIMNLTLLFLPGRSNDNKLICYVIPCENLKNFIN